MFFGDFGYFFSPLRIFKMYFYAQATSCFLKLRDDYYLYFIIKTLSIRI